MSIKFNGPIYKHDCESCRYIGTYVGPHPGDDRPHDWYICGDSILARDGDDGPDYHSWPLYIAIEFIRRGIATIPVFNANDPSTHLDFSDLDDEPTESGVDYIDHDLQRDDK
jgi:hypothetical protein